MTTATLCANYSCTYVSINVKQEGLAVASIAQDDPPLFLACTVTTMCLHAL